MTKTAAHISTDPDIRPHAYDPEAQPEYFEGVLGRRILAFLVDVTIIFLLTTAVYAFLLVAGIFTLGLTWLLFGIAFPLVALSYNAWTLSRPPSATIGMRLLGLEMRTWYGDRMYALLAALHALLYYLSVTTLTPLILLIAPFTGRKRCLHDFLSGTVVINDAERARALR